MAKMTKEEKLKAKEEKKQAKEDKKLDKQLKKAAKKQAKMENAEVDETLEVAETSEGKTAKKGSKGLTVLGTLFVVLQLAASVLLGYMIFVSGVLPVNYMVIMTAALVLLLLITILFVSRKSRFMKVLGIVFAVIFAVIIACVCLVLFKIDTTLNEVAGVQSKEDTMIVAVRVDDAAEEIKDTKGYDFGISKADSKRLVSAVEDSIEEELDKSIKYKEYDSAVDAAQALFDGDIDAAVFNKGAMTVVNEQIEGSEDGIKIIYSYDEETETGLVPDKKTSVEKPYNVLVSVTDSDDNLTSSAVSNVTMLLTVNPETNQILITSIPKNMMVDLTGRGTDSLENAGLYGIDSSVAAVEDLLDVDVDFYLRSDFNSIAKVVDALGGITVKSEYEFTCYNGGFPIEEGKNKLNGSEMLGYIRETESFKTGEKQQEKNQEAVLAAVLKKCTLKNIASNSLELVNCIDDTAITNMKKSQIMTVVKGLVENGTDWEIEKQSVKGTGDVSNLYSIGSAVVNVIACDDNSLEACSNNIKAYLGEEGAMYEQQDEEDTDLAFNDVTTSDWYYSYVEYVSDNGYMSGKTDMMFYPDEAVTKVEAVIILNSIAGSPEAETANIFTDIDESVWYSDFVDWAGENGIAEADAEGAFDPNAEITREELVKMIMNFCIYMQKDVASSGDISAFADASDVSYDCVEAISWAIENNIITGSDDKMLKPQDTTSRAEMAVIINNLMKNVIE